MDRETPNETAGPSRWASQRAAYAVTAVGGLLTAISIVGPWYNFKDIHDHPANSGFFTVHQGFAILMPVTVVAVLAVVLTRFPRRETTMIQRGLFVAGLVLVVADLVATVIHISSPPSFTLTGDFVNGDFVSGSDLKASGFAYAALVGLLLCVAGLGGLWRFVGPLGVGAALGDASLPSGRKRCPECAENVQALAKVCKHCGHRFQEP